MRWIVLAVVLATASGADARMVRRRDPPVVEACRQGKDWTAVTRCLDKLGTFTTEQTLARARLVRVWIDDKDLISKQDAGVYLFVQQADSTWRIGGMFARGERDTVIALAQVTIAGHTGYRLDVGTLQHTPLALDGAPPVQATIRTMSALYCYGNFHQCTELQTACEVMSRGKTLLAFHGKIRVVRGEVFVDGDASRAGSVCSSARRISLGWNDADN